ncbi:MAG: hypothetical protein RMJ66_08645, partial [Bacteroidia bacterium]|nr:hypothetical protein [Bacteroidia bacterium]MDW8135116.1 hypothetical protein [Bacteroidia bacterium]
RSEGVPTEAYSGNDEDAVEVFINQLQSAKKVQKELPAMRRRFQKGERSVEFLRNYLTLLIQTNQEKEIQPVFDAYLKAAGSVHSAWLGEPGFFMNLIKLAEISSTYSEYAIQIADTLRPLLGPSSFEQLYTLILTHDLTHKIGKFKNWKDKIGASQEYIKRLRPRFPFVERLVLSLLWEEGIESKDLAEREKAVELALQSMALAWPSEIPDSEAREAFAQTLNNTAWKFYERVESADKLWVAVSWAKYALALDPQEWFIWDTLGALYLKLKRKAEAINALEKAVSLAKEQGLPEEEYKETLKLLEQAKKLPD